MKRISWIAFTAVSLLSTLSWGAELKVTSKILKEGQPMTNAQVFGGFGCTGENISPDLQWSGAPAGTMFYAVTMYDPDAPTGSGFWHWVVYNIPAAATGLAEKAGNPGGPLPAGAKHGRTDFSTAVYGGPCPPAHDKPHRYIFTVFALKDAVAVPDDATAAMVGFNLQALQLAKGSLTATYGR